jgi:sugar lactone lactonase YvrE
VRFLVFAFGMLSAWASAGGAATLAAGDLLVLDTFLTSGESYRVVQIDPATRTVTPITTAGLLQSPADFVLHPDGRILVADRVNGVIAVDPGSGSQSVLTSGGLFAGGELQGIAVEPGGTLVVTLAFPAGGGVPAVVRVEATGGAQTLVSSGGSLEFPKGIIVGADGALYVCEPSSPGLGPTGYTYGSVIRVSASDGAQTSRYVSDLFSGPEEIAYSLFDGRLYVVQRGLMGRHYYGRVVALDPADGTTFVFAEDHGHLGVAISPAGVTYRAFFMDPKPGPVDVLRKDGDPSWYVDGLAGPMEIVGTAGSTPARTSSWGSVKERYRR